MSGEGLILDYRHNLQKQIVTHEEYLGSGKAKDFAEVQKVVGKIAGLKRAADVFNDTVKKYQDEGEIKRESN